MSQQSNDDIQWPDRSKTATCTRDSRNLAVAITYTNHFLTGNLSAHLSVYSLCCSVHIFPIIYPNHELKLWIFFMWILLNCHDELRYKEVCSTDVLQSMLQSGVLKTRERKCSTEVTKLTNSKLIWKSSFHAMHDLAVKLHWGQVFSRNTKIMEHYHYLSEAGIYRAATEAGAWVLMYFLRSLERMKLWL